MANPISEMLRFLFSIPSKVSLFLFVTSEKRRCPKISFQKAYEGEVIPSQAWTGTEGSRRLRLHEFKTMKVVRLSTLRIGRLYPQEIFLVFISLRGRVNFRVGRIMSMKNSNDTIGNRTRDLPTCSAVPQPTGPRRAPKHMKVLHIK